MPVFGAAHVVDVLTNYRDAIRHVVGKTVAGMNQGLIQSASPPTYSCLKTWRTNPTCMNFTAASPMHPKAYFAGTLGWFDGNPTSLGQLPPAQEARRMIKLVGGADALLSAAQNALSR